MVFYCEQAAGHRSIPHHAANVVAEPWCACSSRPSSSPTHYRPTAGMTLVSRLDRVRTISHDFGYGVGDDMDFLLSKYTRT
jgi:hypothetical protein